MSRLQLPGDIQQQKAIEETQRQGIEQLRIECKLQVFYRLITSYLDEHRKANSEPLTDELLSLATAAHVASMVFLESEGIVKRKEQPTDGKEKDPAAP